MSNGFSQSSEKQLMAPRNMAYQSDLNSKKQVYKSSKGFRVILNSIDEKKISNIKKLQSPTSFGTGLFQGGQAKKKDEVESKDQGLQRNPSL